MRSIFVFIAVLSTIPMVLVKPHLGVLVWSWISYMNPHRLTFGLAYEFPFLDVVAIATALALIFSPEKKRMVNHPVVWLLGIYFLWTCITTLASVYPEQAVVKWVKFSKIMLFTFLSIALLTTKNRLHAFLWIVVLSIGYFGFKGGVFTIITGGQHLVWGPPDSFFEDNNHLALTLVTTIPLLRYMSLHAPNKYLRIVALVGVLLFLTAAIGTHSRGGLVAIFAMLGFMVIRSNKFIMSTGIAALTAVIALLLMPDSWWQRMETIQEFQDDESAVSRIEMWAFTMNVTDDRPLTGGGFLVHYSPEFRAKYLPESAITGRAVHSIYFEVLGEHGYVGMYLFLLIAATAFFTCGRIMRLTADDPNLRWAKDLAQMLQVSMIGFGAGGAFLNLATFDLYYHVIALIVITFGIVQKQLPREVLVKPAYQMPQLRLGRTQSTAAE